MVEWRLTVVDDRGPDGPDVHWLLSLEHPQVFYVRNERNVGVSANFNKCVRLATANHVVFMGCDDLMQPNYVGSVSKASSEHPTAALIQAAVSVIDHEGQAVLPMADRVKRTSVPARGKVMC